MKMGATLFFLLITTLAGLTWYLASQRGDTEQQGNFQVYENGAALELSLDLDTIANVNDGYVRFVNQERYRDKKTEPKLGIAYRMRRLEGRADCKQQQYAMVNASYWGAKGEHVYSQMFQLQRFNWTFTQVEPDSIADTMLGIVCSYAANAPRLNIE